MVLKGFEYIEGLYSILRVGVYAFGTKSFRNGKVMFQCGKERDLGLMTQLANEWEQIWTVMQLIGVNLKGVVMVWSQPEGSSSGG